MQFSRCIIGYKKKKNDQLNVYCHMLLQTAMTDQVRKDRVATPRDLTSKHFVRVP